MSGRRRGRIVLGRLPLAAQLRLYALVVRPRVLLGYTLLQVNPRPALAAWPPRPWSSRGPATTCRGPRGLAYRHALPGAELVYLRHAGHNADQDQPAADLAVVRAFLAGRPLPTPPRTGDDVPADDEGPALV